MAFIKFPSGKIFNSAYFHDVVCISTVLECTDKVSEITHTKANYLINITFPNSNYVSLAYEDKALADADRMCIEKHLISQKDY